MTPPPKPLKPTRLTHAIFGDGDGDDPPPNEQPQDTRVPAFPEFDPAVADGYCNPAYLAIGCRRDLLDITANGAVSRRLRLWEVMAHEMGHATMSVTPIFSLISALIHKGYNEIQLLTQNSPGYRTSQLTVPLPLHRALSEHTTPLEQYLSLASLFYQISSELSEAYAVWISLHGGTPDDVVMTQDYVEDRETKILETYSLYYPNFVKTYNIIKECAKSHGATAVVFITALSFHTLSSNQAASTLFPYAIKYLQSHNIGDLPKNFSTQNPNQPFDKEAVQRVLRDVLPDLLYKEYMLGVDKLFSTLEVFLTDGNSDWNELPWSLAAGVTMLAFGRGNMFFYLFGKDGIDLEFSYKMMNTTWKTLDKSELENLQKRYNIYVFFESIRQQLCQGAGLLCPFWKPNLCCGNRPRLDAIWNRTIRSNDLYENEVSWKREGCLFSHVEN